MCSRYTNEAGFREIRLTWQPEQVDLFREWTPKFNIAPTANAGYEQPIIVLNAEGVRTLKLGRWWLIPKLWPKPLKELPTAFNARAEELHVKPFWRNAFRSTRCLVPATGWREFTGEKGKKQPWHFRPGGLFAFAGLWSTWRSPEGVHVDSFAIVTTKPSPAAAAIHNRMPLVLPTDSYEAWLSPEADPRDVLESTCAAAVERPLEIFPTDPIGSAVQVEDARVIQRVPVPR